MVTLWTVRERKRERETNLKQAEDHQERKQLKSSPHAKSKTTCAAATAQHKPPTLKKQEDCLCSRSTQTHNLKTKRICVAAQHNLPTISKKQKNLCSSSTQTQNLKSKRNLCRNTTQSHVSEKTKGIVQQLLNTYIPTIRKAREGIV